MAAEMATELFGRVGSSKLFKIVSEWLLDYYISNMWKEFKEECSFSDRWRDVVQDFLQAVRQTWDLGDELKNKLNCIRIIAELCETRGIHSSSSQEEGDDEKCPLGSDCMTLFDEVVGIYPFSSVEKSHIRSSLKLQIVLSHCRLGDVKTAENLYSELYSDAGSDEEYQDDVRKFFQTKNSTFKKKLINKYTYRRFLREVQLFFAPVWDAFEPPFLEKESTLLEDPSTECIDSRTINGLFLAWDGSEDAEQIWDSIVKQTHPDVIAQTKKLQKDGRKARGTSIVEKRHSPRNRLVSDQEEPAPAVEVTSVSASIQQCKEVTKSLKQSSRNLFSVIKDPYSKMIEEPTQNRVVNNENKKKSKICATVAEPDSPSAKKVAKQTTQSVQSRTSKRRWNEIQNEAHHIDWSSSSEDDDTEIKHKTIKLSSPVVSSRRLNVKLPSSKQRRKPWTTEETDWLRSGVKIHGEGNWAAILKSYPFVGRTSVNLKDRWRNVQKTSSI